MFIDLAATQGLLRLSDELAQAELFWVVGACAINIPSLRDFHRFVFLG